jgi:hypothetical protein
VEEHADLTGDPLEVGQGLDLAILGFESADHPLR